MVSATRRTGLAILPENNKFKAPLIGGRYGTWNYQRAWSPHPTSMVTGMADGSVRFLGRGITDATWLAALLPNDGEVLGKDWDE